MQSLNSSILAQFYFPKDEDQPTNALEKVMLMPADAKMYLDLVRVAASVGIPSYVHEKLNLSVESRSHRYTLPDLESYSRSENTAGIILSWNESYEKISMATLQNSIAYRQTLLESLCLLVPSEPYQSSERVSIQESLVESYILQSCPPDKLDLLRTLLHAGANPMIQFTEENILRAKPIWWKWLQFLLDLLEGQIRLKGRCRGLDLGDHTFRDIFDITKLFLAHGADINYWSFYMPDDQASRPNYCSRNRCTLRRPYPKDGLDLEIETSAMFILEECFGSEPEFRAFAAAIQPLVEKPTRRIITLDMKPTSQMPPIEHSVEDCELFWPLIERWEQTESEQDSEALQLVVERICKARRDQYYRSHDNESVASGMEKALK